MAEVPIPHKNPAVPTLGVSFPTLGSLQLEAPTVLNAILGATSLCGTVPFSVPFALLLWRGRTTLDQRRWLNLGRLGYVVDWIGLIWMAWVCVWTSFPLYIPVTTVSMNYASAVFRVVVCISAMFYIFSYRHMLNRLGPRSRFS
jgi:choline transport protein